MGGFSSLDAGHPEIRNPFPRALNVRPRRRARHMNGLNCHHRRPRAQQDDAARKDGHFRLGPGHQFQCSFHKTQG